MHQGAFENRAGVAPDVCGPGCAHVLLPCIVQICFVGMGAGRDASYAPGADVRVFAGRTIGSAMFINARWHAAGDQSCRAWSDVLNNTACEGHVSPLPPCASVNHALSATAWTRLATSNPLSSLNSNHHAIHRRPMEILKAAILLVSGTLFSFAITPPTPPASQAKGVYKGQPFEYIVRYLAWLGCVGLNQASRLTTP